MGHLEHKAGAPRATRCFVLTISDTRTEETDTGGRLVCSLLRDAGHQIVAKAIVRDDPEQVKAAVAQQLDNANVQVIITTGGTGISGRDTTVEAIDALLEKRLDGFGELFRMLSYHEIGAAAMMSRATGGVVARRVLFALPGSEAAVRLAMTKLIVPELGHLVKIAES